MRKKVSNDAAVSFFAFMDIVTTVSGSMIFIVLLFAVKLAEQRDSSPVPPPPAEPQVQITNLVATLDSLQAQYRSNLASKASDVVRTNLNADLAALSNELVRLSNSNVVMLGSIARTAATWSNAVDAVKQKKHTESVRIVKGKGTKEPVLAVCSRDQIICAPIGSVKTPRRFPASPPDEFARYVGQNLDKSRESLLLMLKPSAQHYAATLIAHFKQQGFEFGWDALEEKSNILRAE